jgi:hypothetical protein
MRMSGVYVKCLFKTCPIKRRGYINYFSGGVKYEEKSLFHSIG